MAIPENPTNGHLIVQRMIADELEIDVAGGSNYVLDPQEAEYSRLIFTGALTDDIDVLVPAADKRWNIENQTSGAHTLTIKASGTTGVAVTQTKRRDLAYSTYHTDVVPMGPEV